MRGVGAARDQESPALTGFGDVGEGVRHVC